MTIVNGQQTTVGRQAVAVAGMRYDARMTKHGESRANEEASASVPFGVFVAQGSTSTFGGFKKLAAITDPVAGVLVREHAYVRDVEYDDDGMKPGVTGTVDSEGCVWVPAETAMTGSSRVYIRAVAAGAEVAGSVRATTDSTDLIDASAWARCVDYDAASGMAAIAFKCEGRVASPIAP